MADSFIFEKSTVRYRNKRTGRFVSDSAIRSLSENLLAQARSKSLRLNQDLFDNSISMEQWESSQAELIKKTHIQQHKLGVGEMTQRDYGIVGNKLRGEYNYLHNFAAEISAGRLTQAQINQRIGLYYAATWASFQRGAREARRKTGVRWEKRLLNSRQPCAQCPVYSSLGWSPAGFLPNIGAECDCRSNCKCSFVYSYGQARPENSNILSTQVGWL